MLSNFKHHQFPDVNENKVHRKIEGLSEKFQVHSRPREAEVLQNLVTRFLSLHLYCSTPHSTAHYGILSMLLCASNAPLGVTYIPNEDLLHIIHPERDEEDFKWWYSYLMEDVEVRSFCSVSEEEWTSDSDSGSEGPEDFAQTVPEPFAPKPPAMDMPQDICNVECVDSREQLSDLLHRPYWLDPAYGNESDVYIRGLMDEEIIREVLWSLQGCGLGLFGPSTKHEAEECHTLFSFFKEFVTKVHDIQAFLTSLSLEVTSLDGLPAPVIGACLQALRMHMKSFTDDIASLEKERANLTVLGLYCRLSSYNPSLHCLHALIAKWSELDSTGKPLSPLMVLNDVWILLEDSVNSMSSHQVHMVFPVAAMTLRTYLLQVDKCLNPDQMWILKESLTEQIFASVVPSSKDSSSDCSPPSAWACSTLLAQMSELMSAARQSCLLMKKTAMVEQHVPRTGIQDHHQPPLCLPVLSAVESMSEAEQASDTELPISVPFQHVLAIRLEKPVTGLFDKVASMLLHKLKVDFNLLWYIHSIQNVFLMGAGDIMDLFCSRVFESIGARKPWYRPLFLNSVMSECLQLCHADIDDLLSVSVSEMPSTMSKSVDLISVIQLDYKIPYPIDLVFTTASLLTYKEVCHFFMKLKWARWSLQQCNLRGSLVAHPCQHSVYLLKHKLMYFVTRMESYISTVINISVLDLRYKVQKSMKFDDVCNLHEEFLILIKDQCFLNAKSSVMKEIVLTILDMCLKYHQSFWPADQSLELKLVEDMHKDFSKHYHFFSVCLINGVRTGSHLHWTSLVDYMDLEPTSTHDIDSVI